jgi:hypothetical protein
MKMSRRFNKKIEVDEVDNDFKELIEKKGQHKGEEDNIYYKGIFHNDGLVAKNVVISETRTQPLLLKPDEYKLRVVRWTLDLSNEPMFISQQGGALFALNELDMGVELGWTSYIKLEQLKMVSIYPSEIPPSYSAYTNDKAKFNKYYAIYTYQQLINMVNTAFKDLWAIFQTIPGFPYPGPNQDWAPYITLNAGTGILSLLRPSEFVTDNMFIGFSENLHNILNLPYDSITEAVGVIPRYYDISANNVINIRDPFINPWSSTTITFGSNMGDLSGKTGYILSGDHDYRSNWWDLKTIILTSNLPTVGENYSTPQTSTEGKNLLLNVLSDYGVSIEGSEVLNGTLEYLEQYPKYISMKSSEPLSSLRFEFYEIDSKGNFKPISLSPGSSAELRLLFEKIKK